MFDLGPATSTLATVVRGIRDDQLDRPTPCPGTSVAAMLDHVDGLVRVFAAAGSKTPLAAAGQAPTADAAHLADGWRDRIPERLEALAAAWRNDPAWTGTAEAGGVTMPADVTAAVALDEVIVHGWDLARATGQRYDCADELVARARGFVEQAVEENPGGSPGLFGPPVAVPDGAPPLDRLLGLTGRDPGWTPPAR